MPDGSSNNAGDAPARELVTQVWDERLSPMVGPPGRAAALQAGDSLLRAMSIVARRHRWRMLATAAFVTVASAVAYPALPGRYETASQILLQPTGQEGQSEFAREARNSLDEASILSEVEVLASRALAAELVRRLHLSGDPEFNPELRPEGRLAALRRTAMEALRRAGISLPTGPARPARPGAVELKIENNLLDHLKVRRDRRSYVLSIGFWSEDPERAAELANTLAELYIEDQLARKRRAQSNVAGWLEQRIGELRERHDRAEQAVQDYLVESGLVDAAADAALQQQLNSLSSELALAQSRTFDLQARARTMAEMHRAGTVESAPEVLASPLVQHLRERVVTLGAGVGANGGGGPIGAPMAALNELRQAIGAESQRILRATQNDAAVAQQREAGIRDEIARIRNELTRRRLAERRLDSLRREAAADREALEQVMGRQRIEAGRVAALRPDATILTAAEVPLRAAFPDAKMATIGTLALAFLAALTSVLAPLLRQRRAP